MHLTLKAFPNKESWYQQWKQGGPDSCWGVGVGAWGGAGGGGAREEQDRTALLCVSPGVFITTVLGLSMSPPLYS